MQKIALFRTEKVLSSLAMVIQKKKNRLQNEPWEYNA